MGYDYENDDGENEQGNGGDDNPKSPVIFYQKNIEVYVQNIHSHDLNVIVGYEIISYSDIPYASALYYFINGEVWTEDHVWENFVEIID